MDLQRPGTLHHTVRSKEPQAPAKTSMHQRQDVLTESHQIQAQRNDKGATKPSSPFLGTSRHY